MLGAVTCGLSASVHSVWSQSGPKRAALPQSARPRPTRNLAAGPSPPSRRAWLDLAYGDECDAHRDHGNPLSG